MSPFRLSQGTPWTRWALSPLNLWTVPLCDPQPRMGRPLAQLAFWSPSEGWVQP